MSDSTGEGVLTVTWELQLTLLQGLAFQTATGGKQVWGKKAVEALSQNDEVGNLRGPFTPVSEQQAHQSSHPTLQKRRFLQ